jgi:pimeloyl-ACP methyl ester carboxylesterase
MLVIHGAFRDADAYFCMMHGLMQAQDYRDPKDILIIAPDFSYKGDFGLFKSDAFWNNSHPWGDWRAGAHSDRRSGHGEAISSYHIIDGFMLALNNVSRFPNLNEIAIVGHSAGGQAVQRYALTTLLPPKVKNLPLPHPFHSPLLPTFYLPPPYPNLTPTLAPPPYPLPTPQSSDPTSTFASLWPTLQAMRTSMLAAPNTRAAPATATTTSAIALATRTRHVEPRVPRRSTPVAGHFGCQRPRTKANSTRCDPRGLSAGREITTTGRMGSSDG